MRKINAALRYSHGYDTHGVSVTRMAYRSHWASTDQVPQRLVDAGLRSRSGLSAALLTGRTYCIDQICKGNGLHQM